MGNAAFVLQHFAPERFEAFDNFSDSSANALISFSSRLLTFMLSAYLIQLVTTYYKEIRSKSRRMMYGCSKVVDILSVTLDYSHDKAAPFRSDMYRALTCIGHYALHVASGATKDEKNATFDERGLNGELLSALPPKQVLHVLRLAMLQTISRERATDDGCLHSMSDGDFKQLRKLLNDYCGGASSTSSSTTSSKLPYSYVNLINWAVKTLAFFYIVTFYCVTGEAWDPSHGAVPPSPGMWIYLVWFNLFALVILYFVFGVLEVYVSVNDTWHSGLVLQNYHGIIDMICEPLDKVTPPLDVQQLSQKKIH